MCGDDAKRCVAWMNKHNFQQFLLPAEVAFVEEETSSEESRLSFSWREEAMCHCVGHSGFFRINWQAGGCLRTGNTR
jgi:hypothetical protein